MSKSLCYVAGNVAYFTKLPLSEQWGDDWNDAPYEYNAGPPYGDVSWVAFALPRNVRHYEAKDLYHGYISVQDINAGKVPWLMIGETPIMVGCEIKTFRQIIEDIGGAVTEEVFD